MVTYPDSDRNYSINILTPYKMENKKNEKTKEVFYGIVMVAVFMAVGLFWIAQPAEAQEEYKPLTPQAQTAYDKTAKTLKMAKEAHEASTCVLIDAKIMDIVNGVKMDSQLDVLVAKRDKNCDF